RDQPGREGRARVRLHALDPCRARCAGGGQGSRGMSWSEIIIPPRIKRGDSSRSKSIPEGLCSKCEGCESVLYRSDLDSNLGVCPKCNHHHRLRARRRLDQLLDSEGRVEIGAEVTAVDALKFKDSRKYPD